jgi:N-acetylmuramoyl-L-alanine amidase
VSAFQQARGLSTTGTCDNATWTALVEANWRLGDRHLYLRAPMLRGDDVAELQRRLGQLGFDPCRVDGIFGHDTVLAVQDFQHNVGLQPADGICGHATYRALRRLSGKRHDGPSIAEIREQEAARAAGATSLDGHRLAIGNLGAFHQLTRALSRTLRQAGAEVLTLDLPDASEQAREANRFNAVAYIGLTGGTPPMISYYATVGFESIRGRDLADRVQAALRDAPLLSCGERRGMRLPILRETRMPAAVYQLDELDPRLIPSAASALAAGVCSWLMQTIS